MFRLIPFVLALTTAPALAQGFVTDAFGVVPAADVAAARSTWAGYRTGPEGGKVVEPEAPATVLIFVGPKSLVAGREEGQAAALILDKKGNLVADGTPVDFTLGAAQVRNSGTDGGIAGVWFQPSTKAGTYAAGATAAGVQSARATYRVVADLADVAPVLQALPDAPVTETFVQLESTLLSDRFGNPIDDGTGANLMIAHDDGRFTQMSPGVLNGAARGTVLVRDMGQGGQMRLTLGDQTSPPVDFTLTPVKAAGPVPVNVWAVEDLNAIHLRAGPIVTEAGFLLNDGAPVSVTVSSRNGATSRTGWVQDGVFEVLLPLSPDAAPFTVQITTGLGQEVATVNLSQFPRPVVRGAE